MKRNVCLFVQDSWKAKRKYILTNYHLTPEHFNILFSFNCSTYNYEIELQLMVCSNCSSVAEGNHLEVSSWQGWHNAFLKCFADWFLFYYTVIVKIFSTYHSSTSHIDIYRRERKVTIVSYLIAKWSHCTVTVFYLQLLVIHTRQELKFWQERLKTFCSVKKITSRKTEIPRAIIMIVFKIILFKCKVRQSNIVHSFRWIQSILCFKGKFI